MQFSMYIRYLSSFPYVKHTGKIGSIPVEMVRFELMTPCLPDKCSPSELHPRIMSAIWISTFFGRRGWQASLIKLLRKKTIAPLRFRNLTSFAISRLINQSLLAHFGSSQQSYFRTCKQACISKIDCFVFFRKKSGSHLLSRAVSSKVPSAA